MEKIYLKASEETPEIVFDKEKPEFRITGKSYMEDAASFYEPVLKWLHQYTAQPNMLTTFKFELEYVNTASSKIVHDILDILNDLFKSGNEIVIEWHYFEEDEDMLELGEEYQEIYELPFHFQEIDFGRSESMFKVD